MTVPQTQVAMLPHFDTLTPREQAEHLVFRHGFDADHYRNGTGDALTDLDVVDMFLDDRLSRDDAHREDHADLPPRDPQEGPVMPEHTHLVPQTQSASQDERLPPAPTPRHAVCPRPRAAHRPRERQ